MASALVSQLSSLSLGNSSRFSGLRSQKVSQTATFSKVNAIPSTPFSLTIRCARVAGIEIPNNRRIETALTYIHGVGVTTARQVLLDIGMENKVTKELSEEELTTLREEVNKYMTEGDLRRFNVMNIKRLKDIQCYRGKRHIAGLPCRGQHTKCNARTRRGKKITVAGKKK